MTKTASLILAATCIVGCLVHHTRAAPKGSRPKACQVKTFEELGLIPWQRDKDTARALDFYECCFYQRVHGKVWDDKERRRMVRLIRKVSKPCIGFKVLAGNRHTKTPQDVHNALKFAFDNIKPTDVVLLGMWQKYKDQAGENGDFACKILGAGS